MQNISFTLPGDIPAPKFSLFDYVHVSDRSKGCSRGYITGIEYIAWEHAMICHLAHYGWSYTISFIYGKTKDQLLRLKDETEEHWEECLELISVATGGAS